MIDDIQYDWIKQLYNQINQACYLNLKLDFFRNDQANS